MKISVIGCGYLGAVHAASMAELGHDVVGIDVDRPKVEALSARQGAVLRARLRGPAERSAGVGPAALHHRLRRRPRTRRSTSSASAPRRSAASTPPTCATSRPRSSRCSACCGPGELVVGKSTVPGRDGRAAGRAGRDEGPRRDAGLEPRVPARGLRRPGHPAPGPAGLRPARRRRRRDGARAARRGLRADRGRRDAAGGHRLRHRRDGEDRGQLVPRHEDLVHQRDGRAVRGDRRRREAAGRRDRLRRPDRPEVPQRRPRVRRRLPAEGHPGVHGPRRRAGGRPGADVPARGRQHQHAAPDPDGGAGPRGLRRQRCSASGSPCWVRRSSRTATTSATRRRSTSPRSCSCRARPCGSTDPAAVENSRQHVAAARLRRHRRRRPRSGPTRCCCSPSGSSTATWTRSRSAASSGRSGCSTAATRSTGRAGRRPAGATGRWDGGTCLS